MVSSQYGDAAEKRQIYFQGGHNLCFQYKIKKISSSLCLQSVCLKVDLQKIYSLYSCNAEMDNVSVNPFLSEY